MGGICKIKGQEKGAWFEIMCTVDTIKSKEARGLDANYERKLLKSWSKYEGYEGAREALASLPAPIR